MSASLIAHFQMLASYNRLANERLYAACQHISEEALLEEVGASFGSILATLNHLLVGDTIWVTRFEGSQNPSTDLGRILHANLEPLRVARQVMDARIEAVMMGLSEARLETSIHYINNQGLPYTDPLPLALAHFFNHQTHHRGQIHTMLRQLSGTSLLLDLHRILNPDPEPLSKL